MSIDVDYSSSSDTNGNTGVDDGFITQFTYTPGSSAPEPGAFGLMAAGLLALWLSFRRRLRSNQV